MLVMDAACDAVSIEGQVHILSMSMHASIFLWGSCQNCKLMQVGNVAVTFGRRKP